MDKSGNVMFWNIKTSLDVKDTITLSSTEQFYCVTSYLTEKLGNLRSFDRQ